MFPATFLCMALNLVSLVRVFCVLSLLVNCNCRYCGLENTGSVCQCPLDMIQVQDGTVYSCKYCEAGKFRNSETECKSCGVGKWSSAIGQTLETTCQNCDAGKFHNSQGQSSYTSCSPCSEGSVTLTSSSNSAYRSVAGASMCDECPKGKFGSAGNNGISECIDCEKGKFQNNPGTTTCESCVYNEYSGADKKSEEGMTVCSTCVAGEYLDIEREECQDCNKGSYSASAGTTSCTTCEKGKIAETMRLTACEPCDDGTEPNESKDDCNQCPIGKYSNHGTTNTCKKCAQNKFANTTNLGACFDCDNSEGAGIGSNRCFHCYFGEHKDTDSFENSGDNICACPHNYTSVSGNQSETKQTFDPEFTENKEHSHGFYEIRFKDHNVFSYLDRSSNGVHREELSPTLTLFRNDQVRIKIAIDHVARRPETWVFSVNLQNNFSLVEQNHYNDLIRWHKLWNITQAETKVYLLNDTQVFMNATVLWQDNIKDFTIIPTCFPKPKCERGYSWSSFNLSCVQCERGTWSEDGYACIPCEGEGKTTDTDDPEQGCVCGPGWYDDDGTCEQCEVGKYQNKFDKSSCIECEPLEKFSPYTGASACTSCPNGTISTDGNTCNLIPDLDLDDAKIQAFRKYNTKRPGCSLKTVDVCCQGHQFWDEGLKQCEDCPLTEPPEKNFTQYRDNNNECAQCNLCDTGQYNVDCGQDTSAGTCMQCPVGKFKSDDDFVLNRHGKCDDCPHSQTTESSGKTDESDCSCAMGEFLDGDLCKPCERKSYKDTFGTGSCTQCPGTSTSPEGSTSISDCSECPDGSGWVPSLEECEFCDTGSIGVLGKCEPCLGGTYQDEKGQKICKSCRSICPDNEYGDPSTECGGVHSGCDACPSNSLSIKGSNQGLQSCYCAAGYESEQNFSSCSECREGTYREYSQDASPCLSCPPNSTTASTASIRGSDCVCAKNFRRQDTTDGFPCIPCIIANGEYTKTINSSTCSSVLADSTETVINMSLALSVSPEDFASQRDSFINTLAESLGVDPNLIEISGFEETAAGGINVYFTVTPAQEEFVVESSASLPVTVDFFDDAAQDDFRASVAAAAGVDPSSVVITAVSPNGSDGVDIEYTVVVSDAEAAHEVSTNMESTAMDAGLADSGFNTVSSPVSNVVQREVLVNTTGVETSFNVSLRVDPSQVGDDPQNSLPVRQFLQSVAASVQVDLEAVKVESVVYNASTGEMTVHYSVASPDAASAARVQELSHPGIQQRLLARGIEAEPPIFTGNSSVIVAVPMNQVQVETRTVLSMSIEDFDTTSQNLFRQSVAAALGLSLRDVVITDVSLDEFGNVAVVYTVTADDPEAAEALKQDMMRSSMDDALLEQGLPAATQLTVEPFVSELDTIMESLGGQDFLQDLMSYKTLAFNVTVHVDESLSSRRRLLGEKLQAVETWLLAGRRLLSTPGETSRDSLIKNMTRSRTAQRLEVQEGQTEITHWSSLSPLGYQASIRVSDMTEDENANAQTILPSLWYDQVYSDATMNITFVRGSMQSSSQFGSVQVLQNATSDTTSTSGCVAGEEAKFDTESSEIVCALCPIGTFSVDGVECQACQSGKTTSDTGSKQETSCLCAVGYYATLSSVSGCKPCARGSFSNASDSSTCMPCGKGEYASNLGASICTKCSAGSFSSTEGQSVCTQCVDNTVVLTGDAVHGTDDVNMYNNGQNYLKWGATVMDPTADVPGFTFIIKAMFHAWRHGGGDQIFAMDTTTTHASDYCLPSHDDCLFVRLSISEEGSGTGDVILKLAVKSQDSPSSMTVSFGGDCHMYTKFDQTSFDLNVWYNLVVRYRDDIKLLSMTPVDYSIHWADPINPTYTKNMTCPMQLPPQFDYTNVGDFSSKSSEWRNGPQDMSVAGAYLFNQWLDDNRVQTILDNILPYQTDSMVQACDDVSWAVAGSSSCDNRSWAVAGSSSCVTCVQCGPGFYSYGCGTNDLKHGICQTCPPGKFSDHVDSNVQCLDCEPGSFQSKPGQESCDLCPVGNFSSHADSFACEACAAGKFSHARGADECMLCDLGMFQDKAGESGCQSCATGKFSGMAGASECKACTFGKYAAEYSARECKACSPGTYQDHSGRSSCSLCRTGTFSSGNQSAECQACQPGTFAAQNGSQSCDACAAGSNSTWGAKTCIECERCEIDFFNTFCGLDGSHGTCEACAPGKHTNIKPGATSCIACAAGKYRQIQSGGFYSTCEDCATGTYAPPASETCTKCANCPVGKFAQDCGVGGSQGNCTDCRAGAYSDAPGAFFCQQCSAGKYQQNKGASRCESCHVGTSSNSIGAVTCDKCSPGFFANDRGSVACQECQVGKSSLTRGARTCNACSSGTYSDFSGATRCSLCAAGTYSEQEGGERCTSCEPGKYSSRIGSTSHHTCAGCMPGSYSDFSGASACEQCEPGEVTAMENATSCSPCPAGLFASPNPSRCLKCEAGKYSHTRAAECASCRDGTFNTKSNMSTCITCERGSWAVSPHTQCQQCKNCSQPGQYPQGCGDFYVEGGFGICEECDKGSFLKQPDDVSCTECEAGSFSDKKGTVRCLLCPQGSYQDMAGQSVCLECLAGSFQNRIGQTKCEDCQPGTSQPFTGSVQCEHCWEGKYSEEIGAAQCSWCEVGKQSAEDKTGCDECPAAFYRHIFTDPTCQACDSCTENEYNPACGGSIKGGCAPCPSCSSIFERRESCTGECVCLPGYERSPNWECVACSSGSAKNASGNHACSPCAAGEYSPDAATKCSLCREGSYNPQEQASQCIACGDGQTTNERGAVSKDSCLCATGYLHGISQNFTWEVTEALQNYQILSWPTIIREFQSCSVVCQAHNQICSDRFVKSLYSRIDSRESSIWQSIVTRVGQSPFDEHDTLYDFEGYVNGKRGCHLFPYIQRVPASASSVRRLLSQDDDEEFMIRLYQHSKLRQMELAPCLKKSFDTYENVVQTESGNLLESCHQKSFQQNVLGNVEFVNNYKLCPCHERLSGGSCIGCDAGTFKNSTGPGECGLCATGTYSADNATVCSECAQGFFNPFMASSKCFLCGENRTTMSTGATSPDACVCDVGFYHASFGDATCKHCEPGTWNERLNQSACSSCSAGTYNENTASHTEEHCTVCPPGFYCLEGAGSPEKCPQDRPHSAQGSTGIEDCCAAGSAMQYYTNLSQSCAFSICSSGTEVRSWQGARAAFNESFCLECPIGKASASSWDPETDNAKRLSWYPAGSDLFQRDRVIDLGSTDWDINSNGGLTIITKVFPTDTLSESDNLVYIFGSETSSSMQGIFLTKGIFLLRTMVGLTECYADFNSNIAQDKWNVIFVRYSTGLNQIQTKIDNDDWKTTQCESSFYVEDFTLSETAVGGTLSETSTEFRFHGHIAYFWAYQRFLNDNEVDIFLTNKKEPGCQDCVPGKFANMTGMRYCLSCNEGFTSPVGSNSSSDCFLDVYIHEQHPGHSRMCYTDRIWPETTNNYPLGQEQTTIYTASTARECWDYCADAFGVEEISHVFWDQTTNDCKCQIDCKCLVTAQYDPETNAGYTYIVSRNNTLPDLCPCPPGKAGPGGLIPGSSGSECTPCAAGKYSVIVDANSSSSCRDCPAGKFSSAPGSAICTTCAVNSASADGAITCTACTRGQTFKVASDDSLSYVLQVGDVLRQSSRLNFVGDHTYDHLSQNYSLEMSYYLAQWWLHPDDQSPPNAFCNKHANSDTDLQLDMFLSWSSCMTLLDSCKEQIIFTCPPGKAGPASIMSGSGYPSCTPCAAGKYSVTDVAHSNSTCFDCPAGKYSGTIGATSISACIGCEGGKYSGTIGAGSNSTCLNCAGGKFSWPGGTSISACSSCPTGKTSYSGSSQCGCPAGQQPNLFNTYLCQACPDETYKDSIGDHRCESCPTENCEAGFYRTNCYAFDPGGCEQCPAGSIRPIGQVHCVACGEGKFEVNHTSCVECAAGKYQDVHSSSDCKSCAAGKYSGSTGQTAASACQNCDRGKYSSAAAASCTDCSADTKSAVGAASCTNCTLGEVFYVQYNGWYTHLTGKKFIPCSSCISTCGAYYEMTTQFYTGVAYQNAYMWRLCYPSAMDWILGSSSSYSTIGWQYWSGSGDVASQTFIDDWNTKFDSGDLRDECRDKKIY